MGAVNDFTKSYISQNTIFADICNAYLYQGKQVIRPEQLHPLDPGEIAIITGTAKEPTYNLTALNNQRDILKAVSAMTDNHAAYLIIGIENQKNIHYAMPLRNMMYDAQQYTHQMQEIVKTHRNNKKYDNFTSGFQPDDELIPVISIVVYLGNKPWDGAMSLHDMMPSAPSEILQYVADYTLHLIDPHRMDEAALNQFQTNMREIFQFIKHAKDKKKVLNIVQEPRYQTLDPLAAKIINECTNSHLPLNISKEEDINMCQAIDEIREDSRNEGIEIGSINRSKEMAIALIKEKVFTNSKIAELTKLSIEEINQLQDEQLQNA